jgi:hypothetical protein
LDYIRTKDYACIVSNVKVGKHNVVLKDATNNTTLFTGSFQMIADGCVTNLAEL